jgi:hypothetical protein
VRATFLLSKDPGCESTGDLAMAKLIMDLAQESYDVQAICLSPDPHCTYGGYRRVAKPPVRAGSLLVQSIRRRRSLVHTRFDFDELVDAVDKTETDIFVAIHSYMAEAVLRSRRFVPGPGASSNLAVNADVPEAMVWRQTRGTLGITECRRIVRDEIRVARQAYSVGAYDNAEAEYYTRRGIPRAHWLDVTLPPAQRIAVADTGPRLVFLGDRRWRPNQEASETVTKWWPRIAEGIDASLYIVGAPDPTAKQLPLPHGVHDVGFVDDLDAFLASCRAMVAPIRTGGGVRVKILDAATRGLPVIGSDVAVGSLSSVLGVEGFNDDLQMIDQCRRYLLDPAVAAADGQALYEKNAARWHEGKPHTAVQDWLKQ